MAQQNEATLSRILTSPRTDDERRERRSIERYICDLIREELKRAS